MTTDLIQERTSEAIAVPNFPFHYEDELEHPAVQLMRRYAELTRLPFVCVDVMAGTVLAKAGEQLLPLLPGEVRRRLSRGDEPCLWESVSGLVFYGLPLPSIERSPAAAVGCVLARPNVRPPELVLAAAEEGWSEQRLDEWLSLQPFCHSACVEALLRMAVQQGRMENQEAVLQSELEQLTDQIERTYEEITLIHSLARNLQISRSPAEVAEICLSRMHASLKSRGNVIWIEEKNGPPRFLSEGEVPFDESGMKALVAQFENREWFHPLVKNNLEHTPLGKQFSGLKNLVLAPIAEGPHRSGWILVCNSPGGTEFGTVEASLVNSIATILGTHVRNIDLYLEHDELLLCFVRSLVSTLDAKDPYTRGHSDRVALIGRRLALELGLTEQELYDIYLSGLLHDIGKIGVDDRILRKPGSLTEDEFREIQQHPMIGYEILKGLKNLQKVLPGVRHHHESYDGTGYPDGLCGEEIPLMARILAVADAYDAMGSDRPYRKGMPLEKIESIFRNGAGSQWDAEILQAYFAARLDIERICATYSPGEGDLL